MDKSRLKFFFLELIKLGIKHPGRLGDPCSQLLEDMVMRGDEFVKRIIGDYTEESNEYPLNGAGLKLYWRVKRTAQVNALLEMYIGGDQKTEYFGFVAAAQSLIYKEGYWRR